MEAKGTDILRLNDTAFAEERGAKTHSSEGISMCQCLDRLIFPLVSLFLLE